MKRICTLFLMAMALVISYFGGFKVEASAASFSVTPIVSNSPDAQCFVLTNSGDKATFSWDGGSAELDSGASTTIVIGTSQRITLAVKCEADGSYQYAGSMNQYEIPVIKQYGDAGSDTYTELISLAEGQKVVTVDAMTTVGNVMYECASNSAIVAYGDTQVVFNYTAVVQESRNVNVYYIDENGYSIGSGSFTIQPNSSATYTVPATLSVNGKNYNLAEGQPTSINQDYINTTTSYTVVYTAEAQAVEQPYTVTVVYADATNGAIIATNSFTVPVGETVNYNTAQTVVTPSYDEYTLASGQPTVITHISGDETRSYTVYYDKTATQSPYTITFKFVDSVTGKLLGSDSEDVAVNGSVNYQLSARMTVDGVPYALTAGQETAIRHSYGDAQTTYYVNYDALSAADLKAYTVTLKYVNVADNKELEVETKSVAIDSSVEFDVPDTYEKDSVKYVILSGQDLKITHDYESSIRSYAVYYRDINDTSNENTVVTPPTGGQGSEGSTDSTQPDESGNSGQPDQSQTDNNQSSVGGTETTTPGTGATQPGTETTTITQTGTTAHAGTTTTPGTTTTTPGTTGEETTEAVTGEETTESVTGEETTESVTGEETTESATGEETTESVTGEETQGSEIEIEDEDVPLANQPGEEGSSLVMPFAVGGIVVVIVAIAGILFVSNRKKETEKE